MSSSPLQTPSPSDLARFRAVVLERGAELYRDFPWRRTHDPYEVLVSEVMLQQTQVQRVETRYVEWLTRFPTIDALAAATLPEVLEEWQGLGYNRRAIALKRTADIVSGELGGIVPVEHADLVALPGIGPATAAGVRAFAYGIPGVYLETNVRAVVIHELFPEAESVADRDIVPILEAAVDADDPRRWYYALLDYGAHLKRTMPNPSRRSKHHAVQSRFEGSRRQKRAWLLRFALEHGVVDLDDAAHVLSAEERQAGRDGVTTGDVAEILAEMAAEGFLVAVDETTWALPTE